MLDPARRAAVHAALGDATRLEITDRLAPGDASPGELGAAMMLSSNLLAHHLGVLERAGVIRRVRSEGDRRRWYVQLRLDDPAVRGAVLPFGRVRPPARVVFVCTRNSARSQLAHAAWRSASRLPSESAGTRPGDAVHPGARAAARRHGLRLGRPATRHVDDVVRAGDLIVAVCDNAHESLDPGLSRVHWSVPDPVRAGTTQAFDAACAEIVRRVSLLADLVSGPADT